LIRKYIFYFQAFYTIKNKDTPDWLMQISFGVKLASNFGSISNRCEIRELPQRFYEEVLFFHLFVMRRKKFFNPLFLFTAGC